MIESEQRECVLMMLEDKIPYPKIAKYTGVSVEDIKKMQAEHKSITITEDIDEVRKLIQNMCLMDDRFMSLCLEGNIAGTERIVNTILPDKKFKVVEANTQHYIPSALGHDVILDVLATDQYGNKVDIEIQNSSDEAIPKRARYYSSMLDYSMLATGAKYKDLKESYIIFITRYDVLKGGKQLYSIDRVIDETSMKFRDGSHIVYVNCEIMDNTPLGKLIHDLFCKDPEEMYYAELSERMLYLKKTAEGVKEMTGPLAEFIEKKTLAIRAESEEEKRKLKEEAEEERRKLKEELAEKERKLKEEAEEKERKLKAELAEKERKLQAMTGLLEVTDDLSPEKMVLLEDYAKTLHDYKA